MAKIFFSIVVLKKLNICVNIFFNVAFPQKSQSLEMSTNILSDFSRVRSSLNIYMAQSGGLCIESITSQHSCVPGWARRKWSAQDVLLLHFGGC